jgi:hypothetical protein
MSGGASFEASLRKAPQDEDGSSYAVKKSPHPEVRPEGASKDAMTGLQLNYGVH